LVKKGVPKLKLSFEKFDPSGIPLTELIAVQKQFRVYSRLPENLGDGFLSATNPVFRNIRVEFRRRGFKFTHQDLNGYFAFPLMSLDEAIFSRKVPYYRNASWLEKLEKAAPGKFTLSELRRSELKYNYLFHESAHCIAHDAFFGRKDIRRVPKNRQALLKVFLGEAFANTVEALSYAFAEGEIGGYFLDANCHFRASEREMLTLQRAVAKFGAERTALVLMGAFLYSNYLFEKLNGKQRKLIGELAGFEAPPALIRIGLQLNEEFRTATTPLHLVKTGFPKDLGKWMRQDPLKDLLRDKDLLAKARRLAAIAGNGARP
jgi:hypothetical protein